MKMARKKVEVDPNSPERLLPYLLEAAQLALDEYLLKHPFGSEETETTLVNMLSRCSGARERALWACAKKRGRSAPYQRGVA
jgi:hypothetical protein